MAHSKIEAWLSNAEGRAMNPDSAYGNQCVDLADQYAQDLFNVPWPQSMGAVQGAKQILDAAPDAYWTRIDNNGDPNQIPERGDVIVWSGDSSNQWGHVAVVISADNNGVWVMQQDGFGAPLIFVNGGWYSNKPAHKARLGYTNSGTGYTLGWLRPKLAPDALSAPAPSPVQATESFQRTTVATSQVAYRTEPASNATFKSWLEPDHVYDFGGYVRGENYTLDGVTSNIWFKGKYTGGYAWAGLFTNMSTAGLPDLTPETTPPAIAPDGLRTVGKMNVNLRTGPGTQYGLMKLPNNGVPDGQLKVDHEYTFKGYVTNGQEVGGTKVWFVSKSDGYAHVNGFTSQSLDGLADLTKERYDGAATEVATPSTPSSPSTSEYSFSKSVDCVTEVIPAAVGHFAKDGLPKRPMKIVVHQYDSPAKSVQIDSVIGWFRSPNNTGFTSAHFVVQGARIVQMVDLVDRAYHAGTIGNDYIGIETYVTTGGNDRDTFNSVVKLIKALEAKYGYKFEIIDHRSVSQTSCGTDINIPAYRAAVAAADAPVTPAPVPTPTTPAVPQVDELAEFTKFLTTQIDAYMAARRK